MQNKQNKFWIPTTVASASLILLGACSEDDEVKNNDTTDLLIGEWEFVSATSKTTSANSSFSYTTNFGVADGDGYIYGLTFEFQADGDFKTCNSYEDINDPSSAYTDCYDGDWEWVSAGESLKITTTETYDGVTSTYEIALDVVKLTKTEFIGGWSETEDDYTIDVEFTAVKK